MKCSALLGIVALTSAAMSTEEAFSDRRLQAADEDCPGGYVECVDGFVPGTSQTCDDACDGDCCTDGRRACQSFTGMVCRDGISCSGYRACHRAVITKVAGGCIGRTACQDIENVDLISGGSCNGTIACRLAGTEEGRIGRIYNSCHGDEACFRTARFGDIDEMINSCDGFQSCIDMSRTFEERPDLPSSIGIVENSCIGERSCDNTANQGGNIGRMSNSCRGVGSCQQLAQYGGYIGEIVDSCSSSDACVALAACRNEDRLCGSDVTSIHSSCNGENSCVEAAYAAGRISCMNQACNAPGACGQAFVGELNEFSLGFKSCCNEDGGSDSDCVGVNSTSLPEECFVGTCGGVPTATPTESSQPTAPTASPTGSLTARPTENPTKSSQPTGPTESPTGSLLMSLTGKPIDSSQPTASTESPTGSLPMSPAGNTAKLSQPAAPTGSSTGSLPMTPTSNPSDSSQPTISVPSSPTESPTTPAPFVPTLSRISPTIKPTPPKRTPIPTAVSRRWRRRCNRWKWSCRGKRSSLGKRPLPTPASSNRSKRGNYGKSGKNSKSTHDSAKSGKSGKNGKSTHDSAKSSKSKYYSAKSGKANYHAIKRAREHHMATQSTEDR